MTITILIIDKTGKIKETEIKQYNDQDLYKKAGFKTNSGFIRHHVWTIDDLNGKSYSISIYGKVDGRATHENKYEFPPPIDTILFFNSCIITNTVNDKVVSITKSEWSNIYDHLNGGFDECCEDDEEDDEEDYDSDDELTKSGYMKDEFIVDDDKSESEDDDDSDEYIEYNKKKKPKPIIKRKLIKSMVRTPKKPADPITVHDQSNVTAPTIVTTSKSKVKNVQKSEIIPEGDECIFTCTNELIEEPYI
jgi:hypothetical protein